MKDIDGVRALLDLGAVGVCVDIAHGHSDQMMRFVEQLKRSHGEKQVIAGNVCTAMAYHDLVNAGADAVKVGIGPGAACTTRMVTGFGVPQFTAVRDCAEVADKLRVPLIADGGIRGSRDIVLALAAGASTVMIGKLFALTEESAAEKRRSRETGARWSRSTADRRARTSRSISTGAQAQHGAGGHRLLGARERQCAGLHRELLGACAAA